MEGIILHTNFDPKAIQFGPMSKTSKGGKIVYLSLPNNQRIKIQTPIMYAPFGISTFDDPSGGQQSFSLDASFRNYDSDARIAGFLQKCHQLDEVVLETATSRSKEWFGSQKSKEMVAEFVRKTVREPSDPKYAPTMRLKINTSNGSVGSEFYDEHQERVDKNYLTKGCSFRAIIEMSSVWFVGKSFGVTWRVAQLAVVSRPDGLTGYAFHQEDGENAEGNGAEFGQDSAALA